MANAYSLLHNYDEKLFTPDIDLINKVIQTKQTKLDNNRLKIDQTLAEVENLDLIRGVDKEYAANRIKQVHALVSKYENMDLSSNSLTRSINTDIKQVLDDNVKNALVSTKIYRGEQKKWLDFSEKHADKYSEKNHAYAMRNANSWANSEDLNASYNGGGKIIEYKDVAKEINSKLPKALEKVGITTEINEYGQQIYIDGETTLSTQQAIDKVQTISGSRVAQEVQKLLGDADYKQLEINAWDRYGRGQNEESVKIEYDKYLNNTKSTLETQLNDYEKLLKKPKYSKESTQKTMLENSIKQLKFRVNEQKSLISDIPNASFRKMSFDMYQSDFMDGMKNAYKMAPTLLDREVKDNNYTLAKYKHMLKMDEIELKGKFKGTSTSSKSTKTSKGTSSAQEDFTDEDINIARVTGKDVVKGNKRITPQGVVFDVAGGEGEISEEEKAKAGVTKATSFETKIKEDYDVLTAGEKPLFDGPMNSEILKNIGERNAFDPTLSPEQQKAIFNIQQHVDAKQAILKSIKTNIDKSADKTLKSTIASTDIGSDLYNIPVRVVINSDGTKSVVSTKGIDTKKYDYNNLIKDIQEYGEKAVTTEDLTTLELKHKINYARGLANEGIDKTIINSYLGELALEYDPEHKFLPITVEELTSHTSVPNYYNTTYDPSFTPDKKEIYTNKIKPLLEEFNLLSNREIGLDNLITPIVNRLAVSDDKTLTPKEIESIRTMSRRAVLTKNTNNPLVDTDLNQLDKGDFEKPRENSNWFTADLGLNDEATLLDSSGNPATFNKVAKETINNIEADITKYASSHVLSNYENDLILDAPEEQLSSSFNTLLSNTTGTDVTGLSQLHIVKDTPLTFKKLANGKYTLIGDFTYKSSKDKGGTNSEIIRFTGDSQDKEKKYAGRGYLELSEDKFREYTGATAKKQTYNQYSITQQGENAKIVDLNPGLITTSAVTDPTNNSTYTTEVLDPVFKSTFETYYKQAKEAGFKLPDITDTDMKGLIRDQPLNIIVRNVGGVYTKEVRIGDSKEPLSSIPIGNGKVTDLEYEDLQVLNLASPQDKAKTYIKLIIADLQKSKK